MKNVQTHALALEVETLSGEHSRVPLQGVKALWNNTEFTLHWRTEFGGILDGHGALEVSVSGEIRELRNTKSIRIVGLELPNHINTCLANGFQCWTESPLLTSQHVLKNESIPERRIFGDDALVRSSESPGQFQSWSFSYASPEPWFWGALCEDHFLTAFLFDMQNHTFGIHLDTEGSEHFCQTLGEHKGPTRLGAFLIPTFSLSNKTKERLGISDKIKPSPKFPPALYTSAQAWMNLVRRYEYVPRHMPEPKLRERCKPIVGYTSWYLHYNKITDELLRNNLDSMCELGPQNVFQIDDGYERQVGDWLQFSAGFPSGVEHIAREAKQKGVQPGLWVAPFIAVENSSFLKEHPHLLLRTADGNPVLCGNHPLWGGKFYALDTECEELWQHLEKVFHTILTTWGFTFVKADFLYATAVLPAGGLTRAQRSARAHERLYQMVTSKGGTLLSCGAVLSSAYGRCDYSRIGPDVCESWENDEFGSAPSREKVSTRASLVNTFTRAFLSGTAFGTDPDVFLLRDHNTTLTPEQKELLCHANFALGDLVFTSDDVSTWSPHVFEIYRHARKHHTEKRKLARVHLNSQGAYTAEFSEQGKLTSLDLTAP
jgi:hypothetical protein